MWEGGILKKANSTACRTFSWLLCCYTKVVHCAPPSQTAAAAQSCILCFIPLRPLRPQLRKNLDDEGREREEGEPFHCCLVAAQTRPRVRDRRAGCVITLICLREENAFILETKNSRDPTTSKIFRSSLTWHSSNLPRTLKPKEPEQQCLGLRGTPPSLVWAKKCRG